MPVSFDGIQTKNHRKAWGRGGGDIGNVADGWFRYFILLVDGSVEKRMEKIDETLDIKLRYVLASEEEKRLIKGAWRMPLLYLESMVSKESNFNAEDKVTMLPH